MFQEQAYIKGKGTMRGAEGFRAQGQWNATGGTAQEWRVLRGSGFGGASEDRILGLEDSTFWRDKGTGEGEVWKLKPGGCLHLQKCSSDRKK